MSTSPSGYCGISSASAGLCAVGHAACAARRVVAADVDIELDEPHRAGLKIVVIRRGRLRCESGTGPQVG
ncbi:hypothetical protein M8494_25345 [Serratia ureilytica]